MAVILRYFNEFRGFEGQLPNLFTGTPRICNFILLLIVWVLSFSKMLPTVKFAKDKVLVFVILCEKC